MSKTPRPTIYDYDARQGHFGRALEDVAAGARHPLWATLGVRDVRERYHGAALGVFWVIITTAMLALGLATIYSQIFAIKLAEFLPYVTVGITVWSYLTSLLTESTQIFTSAAAYFKQLPLPATVFIYRMALRNLIFVLLRALVIISVLLVLDRPWGLQQLWAIPGLLIITIWGVGLGLLLGPLAARFRDVAQAVAAFATFAFFVTPIFWYPEKLQDYAFIVEYNPLHHLVSGVRAPLLLQDAAHHQLIGLCIALTTLVVGVLAFSRNRSRLAYWC